MPASSENDPRITAQPSAPAGHRPPASAREASAGRRPFWRRRRTYLTGLLFIVGVALCAILWVELGAASVQRAMVELAVYVPALLAIEAARFAAELVSTRLVLGSAGSRDVSFRLLLRGQCLAHACNKVMPAGRAAGEGMKAAVLAPVVGAARAVGVGGAAQIMTLLINGVMALLAAVIVYADLNAPEQATVLLAYGVATVGLGAGVLASLRSELLMGLLRRFRATAGLQQQVMESARSGASFGWWALFWHGISKLAQALQFGLLLWVLGAGLRPDLAVVAEGVQVLGAAAGDLVPAQLGATEGALVLAAPLFGLSGSAALSMAIVIHGTQLLFAAFTLVVAVVLRAAQALGSGRAEGTAPASS